MVISKIVFEIGKGLVRYGPKVIKAEQRVLVKAGYSHKAAQGISHGLFSGAIIGNLIGLHEEEFDDGTIPKGAGNASNKQDKTRPGFQRNKRRRKSNRFNSCKCNRYSNSRRYKFRNDR